MLYLTRLVEKKIAGIKLKSADGWSNGGNGTDDFSFNALSAGGRYPDGRSFSQGILVPNMVPFTPG